MKKSATPVTTLHPVKDEPEEKVEPKEEVKVEVIAQAPDMAPFAEMLSGVLEKAFAAKAEQPKIDVHVHESEKEDKPKKVKIEFERDNRGFIKSPLICTEITNG